MAESSSNSGIRARYTILDEDKVPFQAWRTKASVILDAEDGLDLCDGREKEPAVVLPNFDSDDGLENADELLEYSTEMKSFNKRKKKVAMLIMSLVSDNIAASLEADRRDPAKMWTKLHDDHDRITRASTIVEAKAEFLQNQRKGQRT